MHTDQYKINLRSLPEGDHEYTWLLEDSYFERLSEGSVHGGEVDVDLRLRVRETSLAWISTMRAMWWSTVIAALTQ